MEEYETPIIFNVEPLEDAFVPTRLLHRDGQKDEIVRCLEPALKGKSITNIYLCGPSGTGKTALIRHIIENYFKEYSAYVNCFRFRTTRDILKEILFQFSVVAKDTDSISDMFKKLEEIAKKKIIICLDEVDQIRDSDKDEVLYNLADLGCGLILISNYPAHHLWSLDQRTRDRLNLDEIEFPKYTPEELFDIGKDRRQFSFVPGSLPDIMIRLAAQKADGDARILLLTLKNAGKIAEERGAKRVETEDVIEGNKEAKKLKKSYLLRKLNDDQRIIYSILEKNHKMYSGDLYREYCKSVKKPVTQRGFRNYMKRIVNLGLVKAEGGEGRYRKYEIVF
jgi:cell division control protein 6